MNFSNLIKVDKQPVIGLDIGTASVKVVQLRKEKDVYTLLAANSVEIENQDSSNDIDIARAIRKCLENANVNSKFAVCSLCGPEVASRSFKFPVLPENEIEGAVMLEASQVCPFSVGRHNVDYQIISNNGNIIGVLVAATSTLIENRKRLVQEGSLKPVFMDIDGLALLNCIEDVEENKNEGTFACLNVGHSFTTLAVLGQDKMPFIRDIAYGASDIYDKIAVQNKSSVDKVRSIFSKSKPIDKNYINSLENTCKRLFSDASETLRFYSANHKTKIDRLYVCGGFSKVEQFVDLVGDNFNCDIQVFNPFKNMEILIDGSNKADVENDASAFAVAVGLAMRTM